MDHQSHPRAWLAEDIHDLLGTDREEIFLHERVHGTSTICIYRQPLLRLTCCLHQSHELVALEGKAAEGRRQEWFITPCEDEGVFEYAHIPTLPPKIFFIIFTYRIWQEDLNERRKKYLFVRGVDGPPEPPVSRDPLGVLVYLQTSTPRDNNN